MLPVPQPGVICTRSGKPFSIVTPEPHLVDIRDIAYGLSNVIRFGGHASPPYSVAMHSIDVARRVQTSSPAIRLGALLHDAAEAYLGDMPTPFKCLMPDYCRFEQAVQSTIYTAFGLPAAWAAEPPREITQADREAYEDERASLMPHVEWWPAAASSERPMKPISQVIAERLFLHRFEIYSEARRTALRPAGFCSNCGVEFDVPAPPECLYPGRHSNG